MGGRRGGEGGGGEEGEGGGDQERDETLELPHLSGRCTYIISEKRFVRTIRNAHFPSEHAAAKLNVWDKHID